MDELKEKIKEILENKLYVDGSGTQHPQGIHESVKDISKEIKDIAFDWGDYFDDAIIAAYSGKLIPTIDRDELFDQFIKERYR